MLLTSSLSSRDITRLAELPVTGLVIKPLTREKVGSLLQLHFQRQLPEA